MRVFIGNEFHGIFSVLTSLFYFAIVIGNSGFDNSIASVWRYFTDSKNRFLTLLRSYALPQLLLIISLSIAMYIVYHFLPLLTDFSFLSKLINSIQGIPASLMLILCITFITESIKKSIKYFLQLAFYNSVTACVEFFGMLLYILLIWTGYTLGYTITQFLSFSVLLSISIVQLSILIGALLHFYKKLPNALLTTNFFFNRTRKNRFFIFSNQLINQFFSGNTLVPLCAYVIGLDGASFIKVVTSITQWIILIAQKILGVSTIALLSQAKETSSKIKKDMFVYSNTILQQVLYFVVIFLLFNSKTIIALQMHSSTLISLPILYFLLSMSFIESFFVVYEKWFMIEEKMYLFFGVNSICLFVLYLLAHYAMNCSSSLTLVTLLCIFAFIRLSGFLFLMFCTYLIWNIKPKISLQLQTLVFGFIFSTLFYITMRLLSTNS